MSCVLCHQIHFCRDAQKINKNHTGCNYSTTRTSIPFGSLQPVCVYARTGRTVQFKIQSQGHCSQPLIVHGFVYLRHWSQACAPHSCLWGMLNPCMWKPLSVLTFSLSRHIKWFAIRLTCTVQPQAWQLEGTAGTSDILMQSIVFRPTLFFTASVAHVLQANV